MARTFPRKEVDAVTQARRDTPEWMATYYRGVAAQEAEIARQKDEKKKKKGAPTGDAIVSNLGKPRKGPKRRTGPDALKY